MNTKNLPLTYLKLQSLACILHREISHCTDAVEEMAELEAKVPNMAEGCRSVAEQFKARREEAQEILDAVDEVLNPR